MAVYPVHPNRLIFLYRCFNPNQLRIGPTNVSHEMSWWMPWSQENVIIITIISNKTLQRMVVVVNTTSTTYMMGNGERRKRITLATTQHCWFRDSFSEYAPYGRVTKRTSNASTTGGHYNRQCYIPRYSMPLPTSSYRSPL
jgi:hypothetical protein